MTANPCSIDADKSVAQADVARMGNDRQTGEVVQEISDQEG
jgi:hypothetical protein